ncbi:Amino acid transporter transmembrane, partial [Macrophomina phaseolina MS6]
EVIPVFSPLLGITAALFNPAFTLYLPGIMWFKLIKEGGCFSSPKNIALTIVNAIIIAVGLTILGAGTYASVQDIVDSYAGKSVGKPFSCKA